MRVILLKDVARVGRKFEVKDVPDGYVLNFLMPRKLAERATADAVKRLESRRAALEAGKAEQEAEFKTMVESLGGALTVVAEANEQGVLFRAIHASDIMKALSEKGFTVDEEQIIIEEPIKSTGAHTIRLAGGGIETDCAVNVEGK